MLPYQQHLASGGQQLIWRMFPSAGGTNQLPAAFYFPLLKILSSMCHITHRLTKAWLTKLTPPINPIRDLQITGCSSAAQNGKIIEMDFRTSNN